MLPTALENLIGGYPSHNFVIDREEAAELFNNVQSPTFEEADVYNHLWELFVEPAQIIPLYIDGEKNEFSTQLI